MKTFVISLGGSIVAPSANKIDAAFLRKFRAVILKYVRKGSRFAIIVGGGKPCRMWQDAARKLGVREARDLDWIGIRATQINAELVRAVFGKLAHSEVVCNPAQKINKFKILLGAGYLPGHSSDYDAVLRAKTLKADAVINLSNVPYVYDKNPQLFQNAKPLRQISWLDFFKLFGRSWVPGGNVPFDQIAAKTASGLGMKVIFIGGSNLTNFEHFLQGKEFDGTIIGDLNI